MLEWLLQTVRIDRVSSKARRLCRGNPDERRAAERELSQSQDARAIPALLPYLADQDALVRGRAAQGLSLIGGAQAAEGLVKALWDVSDHVRKIAAGGLDRLQWRPGDDALGALYAFAGEREAAQKEFGRRGPGITPALIPLLRHAAGSVRGAAARFLAAHGDQRAIEPLTGVLNHPEKEVRLAAALALGKHGDKRAVEPLIELLKDENMEIRIAAAEVIGNCGDARAVEPLRRVLKDDYMEVRVAAAEALGKCGDRNAVEPLIQAFKDNPWDAHVQGAATRSLGLIGKSRALVLLQAALEDPSANVRRSAADALGALADARAVDLLVPLLEDADVEVRGEASAALIRLGAADRVLARAADLGSSLLVGIAQKLPDTEKVELLLRLLTQGLATNKMPELCSALGAAGDERAVVPLLACVSNSCAAKDAADALQKILGRCAPGLSEEVLRLISSLVVVVDLGRTQDPSAADMPAGVSGFPDLGVLKQLALQELDRRNPGIDR